MKAIMRIGNCRDEIWSIDEKISTWIIDPPYNIGFNYKSHYNDRLPQEEYDGEIISSLIMMSNCMEDDGSIFIIHYPDKIYRIMTEIEDDGRLELHQWITWVYPQNIGHGKKKFTRASRCILWLKKKGMMPKFNHLATYQEYKNKNDKRIQERIKNGSKGTVHYDWWELNICKNVSKDYRGYRNQIPYKVLERLILHTTNENDIVGDCYAGSGSTIIAALKNNRRGWGCEINEECKKYWKDIEEYNDMSNSNE